MNALACGATVMGSDTAPVREMIRDGENGLLFDFFDIDAAVDAAEQVLDDPDTYRAMGETAAAHVRAQYSLDACLPQILELYQSVLR